MIFSGGRKSIAISLLVLLILLPISTARGAGNPDFIPYCLSVTFAGDPQTSRGFTWYTEAECAGHLMLAELAGDQLNVFRKAQVYLGKSIRAERRSGWEASRKMVSVHRLELTGLKPDTAYAYKVGDAGRGIWSEQGTFKTAAAEEAFQFLIIADSQGEVEQDYIKNAQTLQAALATMPEANFLVHMGDFVQSCGSEDSYENFKQWQQFFATARTELMHTTIMPVAGNHDSTKDVFSQQFTLGDLIPLGANTESGAYYSVNYANTCFIILNTNEGYGDNKGEISAAQIEWLKTRSAQADEEGKTWKILLLHRAIYSFGRHLDSEDIVILRGQLAPLISDLGIDLVLQGHDHVYMRSQVLSKLASGQVVPQNDPLKISRETFKGEKIDFMVNPQGTTYIVPNVSGSQFGNRKKSSTVEVYPAAEYKAEDNDEPVFAGISIEGERLCYQAWAYDREGNGEIKEIDRYAILKTKVPLFRPLQLLPGTYYAHYHDHQTLSWENQLYQLTSGVLKPCSAHIYFGVDDFKAAS